MNSFPVQLGGSGIVIALVIWSLSKLIPVLAQALRSEKNGKSFCVLSNTDIVKLQAMEIRDKVAENLGPKLDEQTRFLREIRDGVRDLKR